MLFNPALVTAPLYVTLLHYPIVNRDGKVITTAVTNMDIHDIARTCRTYDVTKYFMVTPIEVQQVMVGRILSHWRTPESKVFHPDRVEAVDRIQLVNSFDDVIESIQQSHGQKPQVVMTDARELKFPGSSRVSYADLRSEIESPGRTQPVLLVFGTGWGLADEFFARVDRLLPPVYGPEGTQDEGGYNHLSVRSAVAIILDRLRGH